MAEFLNMVGVVDYGNVRTHSEKYSSIVVELSGAVSGAGTVTLNDTFPAQIAPGHIWVAQVDSLGNQVVGTLANANSIDVGSSHTYVRFWIPWKPGFDGEDLAVAAGAFQITCDTASDGAFTLNLAGLSADSIDDTCGVDNDNTHCAPGYSCQSNVCKTMDAGVADASVADASVADASVADAKVAEASVADAKIADASVADVNVVDARVSDAKVADVSVADVRLIDVPAAEDGSPEAVATDACIAQTCDDAREGARNVAEDGPRASGDAATCTDSQCDTSGSQGTGSIADEGGCGCRIAHRDPANACLLVIAIGVALALTRKRSKAKL